MAHFEKELDRREIYRGKIFTVTSHRVETEGGAETARDVVNHHGGACVAAVDPGEDPEAAAARELEEETGYRALALRKLARLLPTPAYCTEVIHIYEARGLVPGRQHLDRDEYLDVAAVPFDRAVEMVLSGEIIDAKTQTGLLMLALRRREEQESKGKEPEKP